jgi:S1-C subfamily serine protease
MFIYIVFSSTVQLFSSVRIPVSHIECVFPVVLHYRGDIIMEVNGATITNVKDIFGIIGGHVGKTFKIKVMRDYNEVTLYLTTAQQPQST